MSNAEGCHASRYDRSMQSGQSGQSVQSAQSVQSGQSTQSPSAGQRRATVLVYASNSTVRDTVRRALGAHPAHGLEISFEEATTGAELIARADLGGLDLLILDGEAAPTGGLGLCRQLKDELDNPPPVLVLVGRRDDAWLATWSRAEAVVLHPIDALQLTDLVVSLLTPAETAVAVVPGH